MAEVCTPLRTYQREDGEIEAIIGAENTWADVLRYVAEDLGWNETVLIAEMLREEAAKRGEDLDGRKTRH